MEGHFIRGVGDGVVESDIALVDDALEEADRFLAGAGHVVLAQYVERVARLIDGFQSPYGMELLATVHWVTTREKTTSFDATLKAVRSWDTRKAQLMQPSHVRAAWEKLAEQGWIANSHGA